MVGASDGRPSASSDATAHYDGFRGSPYVVGLILTVVQFMRTQPEAQNLNRSLVVGSDGVKVSTTYVGLLIVALGVVLEAVAAYLWEGVG